ncbi:MAG: GDP-D-mannose 3',5'-epimerase [Polaribacter sp.]|jgi:GDP-D-mannose 3',5'-epimerase
MKKKALVLGAGGFIGTHLVSDLKQQGFWVRGVDLKYPEYSESDADEFIIADLGTEAGMHMAMDQAFDEVHQLAADMGGAGYIFTGENDAQVMRNSSLINLLFLKASEQYQPGVVFYASSACVYPQSNQGNTYNPTTAEDTVYPADPDSDYGWEKLNSERLYLAHARNSGLNVRIGRFHNVFGPLGSWGNGKEKAPAAICRKVAEALDGGSIEVWGDGEQTRSFLFIEECLIAMRKLMNSDLADPINIGSSEMVSINQLAEKVISMSGKRLSLLHIEGPQGVRGRSSDNRFIEASLGWRPQEELQVGLKTTYEWINDQVESKASTE